MYQPYPGESQTPESSQRTAPASVVRAAQVMYVGAGASLIGIVIDFLGRSAIRTALHNNRHKMTASQLTTTYHVVLGVFIVAGLITVGLWIWMAMMTKAGKSWARIVSTVLFAINTIDLIAGGAVAGGAARIYGIVIWLIGLAAVFLLWQRPSSDYFRSAPTY